MLKEIRKQILVINFFVLSCIVPGCNYDEQNKTGTEKNKTISTSQKENNNATQQDTIQFKNLADLLQFFRKRSDSIETLKKAGIHSPQFSKDIGDSIYSLTHARNNSIYNFLIANEKGAENFEGLKYIVMGLRTIQVDLIDNLFHKYPDSLQQSKYGKWLASQIEKRRKTEDRAVYDLRILNLTLHDTKGKPISLNEIPADYILLDFWASWCTPCRYENRVLIKEKDRIEKKGLVAIVAISLDDKKEKWIKASEQDSLSYLNLCDYKAFDSPLAKEFNITGIPYNVLINKKGKIFAGNLWGEKLISFIRSMPE